MGCVGAWRPPVGSDCRNPAILTGGGRSSMIYSDEQDTARVAKVILCDPSKMALLSRFPAFRLMLLSAGAASGSLRDGIAAAPSRQPRPTEAGGEAFPLARLRVLRGEVLGSEERAQPQYPCRGVSRLRFKPELRVGSRQNGPRHHPVRLPPEVPLQDFHRVLRTTREVVGRAEVCPGRIADRVEREDGLEFADRFVEAALVHVDRSRAGRGPRGRRG